MKKPILILLEELTNIKANRKELLKETGYVSILEVKKEFGFKNADAAYDYLFNEYNKEIKQINKNSKKVYDEKMKNYLQLQQEKELKEMKKKQEAKKQQSKKSKEIKEIKKLVKVLEEPSLSTLRELLQKFISKNVIIQGIKNGAIVFTFQFDIPKTFSSWWKKTFWRFMMDSNTSILDEIDKIVIYEENPIITNAKIIQAFKDGITNCLLTPINLWANEMYESSQSKSAKIRYATILKRVNEFEEMYKNGVPENAISDICNKLQIDISVQMPLCETKFIECQSTKKRLKHFSFINTRINHVDYQTKYVGKQIGNKFYGEGNETEIEKIETNINAITTLTNYIESSKEEICEIIEEHKKNDTFCYYNRNKTVLYTLTNVYKVVDEFNAIVNDFENDNNMNEYLVDDITQKELSEFIREGTHYNSTIDFVDKDELLQSTNHYDMEKAYANFKNCKFYTGFLGKITDFRECDSYTANGIGLYKITNLDFSKAFKSFVLYNDKMKIYKNNCVYSSPELDMLKYNRVCFDVIAGCWGVKEFDFEFNDDMLYKKTDGVSYYAKWCGMIDSHKLTKDFWFNGDYSMAQMLNNNYGEGIVKWYENNEICVSYPKKHNFHKGHITAFITAYQRISVIEQLMEIEFNNVKRICVDGIYFSQKEVVCKNVFRNKTDMKFGNDAGDTYISNNEGNEINNFASKREHNEKELWLGAGGNGKTHNNLIDNGLVKVLYVAPSWKLARNKQKEYGCKVNVWANILSPDPEKINSIKRNNVLLIDEVSMMTEDQKKYIFETYSNMKLIFCGDLGFQLPCVVGIEMNNEGFDKIIKLNVNHRCKDKRLLNILNVLREMISYDLSKFEINNYVVEEFKKLGRYITIDNLVDNYAINDMILTGTNMYKDYITNLFKGKFETEKYYITSNNRLYSNGEIIIGEKPDIKCEVRHAYTTHSIQGETAYHNLFIECSKMFDSRMFYTALSRAKTLDQIFIVKPNDAMKEMTKKKVEAVEPKNNLVNMSYPEKLNYYNEKELTTGLTEEEKINKQKLIDWIIEHQYD